MLNWSHRSFRVMLAGVFTAISGRFPNTLKGWIISGVPAAKDQTLKALAAPVDARKWLAELREHTDKPVRNLVLSHYQAVRVLGASAFDQEVRAQLQG